MKKEVLRMERITYLEHGVTKLEDFNLNVFEGEILGFVPVNSHGREEFLRLLKENLSLYDGYVYYNEILVNSWKHSLQVNNRITVIQNESCLVDGLTVTDNIFVLRPKYGGEYIKSKVLQEQLKPFLEEIDVDIEANSYVFKLSVFERVVVEILKGVILGHKLIVLNEIETMLTANELSKVLQIIKYYKSKGISFIYICLHMEDTAMLCDRVVLLMNGRIEKVLQHHELQIEKIESIFLDYASMIRVHLENKKEDARDRREVCEMRYQFQKSKVPFRFQVHEGECLVIQCLDNEMYYEIRNAIVNQEMNDESCVRMDNKRVQFRQNIEVGIIQEFASKTMLFPHLSYMDNLCFNLSSRMSGVWFRRNIKRSIRMEFQNEISEEVYKTPISELTEKQKYQLVYKRILLQKPKVVFCVQPFQGADLDHRMYIWTLLEGFLNKGIGVVILAVNLADTLSIADRFVRVDDKNQQYEFVREEFASMPSFVPWQFLYKEQEQMHHVEMKNNDESN